MKVILAENAGTCFGVERALELVNEVAHRQTPAMTLGPLIHNPRVVGELERQGVGVAMTPKDVSTPLVVIRSHGVLPEVREELESRNLEIVDATCPYVLRAQKKAAKLASTGNDVIIVGEKGHPEVEGLTAWAEREGARVFVVTDKADLPNDLSNEVGVVVQTTQRKVVLDGVLAALEDMGRSVCLENTICSATTIRQNSAAELAKTVDAMVVLGGKNSSNTTRLAEICRTGCTKTIHVEGAEELDPPQFIGCKVVGLTAGASTPQSQIEEMVSALEAIDANGNLKVALQA